MEIIKTAILGLVQGITEFLPISSSGHLFLIQKLFGWQETRTSFTAAVHLGTLIASIVVFRTEIMVIIEKFFKSKDKINSDIVKIIAVSIPVLIVGFLVKDLTEKIETPVVVAVMLVLVGVFFLFFPAEQEEKEEIALPNWKNTLLISLAQILAFIPGTSRSGTTILTGRALGIGFTKTLYTSFIISIPVIAAAGLWGVISETRRHPDELLPFGIGLLTSLIAGYIACSLLKGKLPKIGLRPFGIYRIILGTILLISQVI